MAAGGGGRRRRRERRAERDGRRAQGLGQGARRIPRRRSRAGRRDVLPRAAVAVPAGTAAPARAPLLASRPAGSDAPSKSSPEVFARCHPTQKVVPPPRYAWRGDFRACRSRRRSRDRFQPNPPRPPPLRPLCRGRRDRGPGRAGPPPLPPRRNVRRNPRHSLPVPRGRVAHCLCRTSGVPPEATPPRGHASMQAPPLPSGVVGGEGKRPNGEGTHKYH